MTIRSRPTARDDKCFYYAPDYNLNRFETAQGYIASNHINAKVSSISFGEIFYLMSIRIGDGWIKISKTVALNRIRKSEELEKGWRKDEIAKPVEFRDLDLVHVVPLKTVLRKGLLGLLPGDKGLPNQRLSTVGSGIIT